MKIYASEKMLAFGAPGKYLATLSMLDGQLTRLANCDDNAWEEIGWEAKNFVIGQVFKLGSGQEVVLGRPGPMLYEVTLSAPGNPDHRQLVPIAPSCKARGNTIEEIVASCMAYRDQHDLGMGNWGKRTGVVFDISGARRKNIGRVSYNGRFQTAEQVAEMMASLKKLHENTEA